MGIPAEDARDVVAGHGAVARDDVFDVTGQQVAIVRQAIGKGRAIIKDVLGATLCLFEAGFKSIVGRPVLLDFLLHVGEAGRPSSHIDLGINAADVRRVVAHLKIPSLVRCDGDAPCGSRYHPAWTPRRPASLCEGDDGPYPPGSNNAALARLTFFRNAPR